MVAGLVLFVAMLAGFYVWMETSFVAGAATFIVGAVGAGGLHNVGSRGRGQTPPGS